MRTKITLKRIMLLFLHCVTSIALFSQQLIKNGNFCQANTGFTSEYSYCKQRQCLLPETTYAIGSNANFFHPDFVGTDHTTGTGNFMIINGATESGYEVWKQTVPVNQYTEYKFSVWVSSMVSGFPAKLNFLINGVSIGKKTAPSSLNQWEKFSAIWNSGTSGLATIVIVDLNIIGGGNDFGLDDISFKHPSSILSTNETSFSESSLTELSISPAKLSLYPNPSTGKITVNYNTTMSGKVEMIVNDFSGRTIFSKTNQTIKGTNTYYLNVPNLKPGMYFLQIADVNQKERIKFTVQK